MPAIIIKDYVWRQTPDTVVITVPLPGHPKNVDLFVVNNYIKASFPPFIFELFPWAKIIEEGSKCAVSECQIVFSLQKEDADLHWPSLELDNLNKDIKREYRNRALECAEKSAEDRARAKNEKQQLLQKEAVRAQINLDTATLNRIDAIRNAHRNEAMRDFEDWRLKAEMPILKDVEGKIQNNRKAYKAPLKWFKDDKGETKSRAMTDEEIFSTGMQEIANESIGLKTLKVNISDDINEIKQPVSNQKMVETHKEETRPTNSESAQCEKSIAKEPNKIEISNMKNKSSSSEDSESDCEVKLYKTNNTNCFVKEVDEKALHKFYKRKQKERPGQELIDRILKGKSQKINKIFNDPARAVPLPRKVGTINVKFSERAFPTPARESAQVEEQEWLAKQAEARRKTGFVTEDLRPEEQDPQWLKDKGDEFFKAGNYLGAISVYTHGIKISNRMAALYVNRSAAHYALGNYYRCTEDCSMALELMEPKCESNRESRARCHARRGAALCKLSAPQHGIPELEAALELDPNNKSIKHDLLTARQYFNMKN